MSLIYYVGQLCAIVAWILLLISYHAKRENKVILYQILSSILYIANYFCIGAFTGFWISLFELAKSIGYYKTDKDKYIYLYTIPVYGFIIYFTGFNIITLFAVLGSLIDGYVMLKDKKTMVVGGIVSYTLWIIYDLCFLDFAGAISDLFVVISNISILVKGYTKYLRRSNIYTIKALKVSLSSIHEINKLDNQILDREYRWDEEKIIELTKKHKYSYILVKDENKIIGYINFLSIKEDIYNKMIESTVMYDEFSKEDLVDYQKNKESFVNLNAIVLNDEYNNSDTIKKIETSIENYINTMKENQFIIKEMCCFAVNYFEVKILEDLGFEKIRDITNESFLYRKIIQK